MSDSGSSSRRLPLAPPSLVDGERIMQMIADGRSTQSNNDLLVYIHVPFCTSKCHFCDWVVHMNTAELTDAGELRDAYVGALCDQIKWYGPRLMALGYAPTKVYWGGGTPTRLSPEQLERIGTVISNAFDLSRVREYTLECSPETLTAEKIAVLRRSGVNRISIGVQSFDNDILRRMGRSHDASRAEQAIALLKDGGIENFNIDLIVGFPEQSVDSVRLSVARAIELGVPHISVYYFHDDPGLVITRQVKAGRRPGQSVEDRLESFLLACSFLAEAGYSDTILGYFAKSERFRFLSEEYYFALEGDNIGFGAGAYSIIGRHYLNRSSDIRRGGAVDLPGFIRAPTAMESVFSIPDLFEYGVASGMSFDYITSALTTSTGLRYDRWFERFGFTFDRLRQDPGFEKWRARIEGYGCKFAEHPNGFSLTPETRTKLKKLHLE